MSDEKFKRNYRACLNCRVRKVKCDLGLVDSPRDGKCARCLRERKDCVFVESRRGGAQNVIQGKLKKELASGDVPTPQPSKEKDVTHFSTMEGALVFLANAAGTIAKADERDNIDAHKKHKQLESGQSTESPVVAPAPVPRLSVPQLSIPYKPSHRRLMMPAVESAEAVRPRGSSDLLSIDYIGGPNGIVSEDEARKLIHLFFTTMHPYFPHIPKFLHSPLVLSGYPILLCAILTILARYHPFDNNVSTNSTSGVPRNIEVHDRLWLYVQRLISQTVWAEASTRSIGTVFAFLLFTEWNPRAIHWRWLDYANRAEDGPDVTLAAGADEPTGLGAMRRSDRMAWMLIGLAVRLAQDTGFMEFSSKTFLSTHIAEINSVMNISRRLMLAHSLSEVDLDEDEVSEETMEETESDGKFLTLTEDEIKRISSEQNLKFTRNQKAKIELLQIMSLGHEALYGYKAQLGSLSQRQNLSVLNVMSPLINSWGRKYKDLLVPSTNKVLKNVTNLQQQLEDPSLKVARELQQLIEYESFIFEFNYAKLYIYSLALSPLPKVLKKHKKLNLKLDEISKSAKYIEQAFRSANEMLFVAHRIHKLKLLRFMPVRWMTRIVRAVAFIVKCYLTITAHKTTEAHNATSFDSIDLTVLLLSLISVDEIVQSIQRAAITLRDCSPDELHLCTRYSNVLMYLCSEMKTKAKYVEESSPKRPRVDMNYYLPNPDSENYQFNYDNTYFRSSGSSGALGINTPLHNMVGDSEVMEWFVNDRNIGLDFVGPWTEMIEQQLNSDIQFNFDLAMS